ncbi:MAG: MlaC/ttg2D family ABC transporter substrate-binding protein [Gammaproteobacteria bacterium]|jgi:phospholipid transport system substrate-binding protein
MKVRLFYLTSLLLCFFSFSIHADEQNREEPGKIVKDTVDQVLLVLQDDSLDEAKRKELITNLITPRINFKDMSRRILATNWKAATEQQQQQFTDLFQQILINTYWIRMNQYAGERVEYISVSSEREAYATVDTIIVRDESDIEIPLSYRMKRFVDVWYAYDFVVEALSLVQSYRNEYNATIKNYGIDGLLELLQQEVDSYTD